jgi:hypothetical protein
MFMPAPNMSVVASASGPVASPSIDDPVDDPVPAEVHAVIELFANQLAKVSFPDIDAGALRRQADELRTEAKAVARAREALDAALAVLEARRAALGETARRAVAYAQIYSEAHPDRHALAAALAALAELSGPRPAAAAGVTASGKRRGRPPRRSAELFDATAQARVSEDPA